MTGLSFLYFYDEGSQQWVAFIRELNVSGYGPTRHEALEMAFEVNHNSWENVLQEAQFMILEEKTT